MWPVKGRRSMLWGALWGKPWGVLGQFCILWVIWGSPGGWALCYGAVPTLARGKSGESRGVTYKMEAAPCVLLFLIFQHIGSREQWILFEFVPFVCVCLFMFSCLAFCSDNGSITHSRKPACDLNTCCKRLILLNMTFKGIAEDWIHLYCREKGCNEYIVQEAPQTKKSWFFNPRHCLALFEAQVGRRLLKGWWVGVCRPSTPIPLSGDTRPREMQIQNTNTKLKYRTQPRDSFRLLSSVCLMFRLAQQTNMRLCLSLTKIAI